MTTKDWIEIALGVVNASILCVTAFFIYRSLHSPIDAVKIGRQLNTEEKKDDAKRSLFLTLFSLRGNPLHYDFVRGLNEIDVVFQDVPAVLDSWHNHFRDLHNKSLTDPDHIWNIGRTTLLSQMAIHLGYGTLNQTDIMQNYFPVGHGNRQRLDDDLRVAALKFFETGHDVYEAMIDGKVFGNKEKEDKGQNEDSA